MPEASLLPTAPPLVTTDLPGTGGRIGDAPEDFQVDEIPLYEPAGEGEHLYLLLEKRGWNTLDALRVIARAAGVRERDMGSAGMKDRHAVTTQWISLPPGASVPEADRLPEGLRIRTLSRHRNKLRTGHLLGNRFVLRIVDVTHPENAPAIAERLRVRGTWNGFGPQRFGHGGRNVHRALAWLDSLVEEAGRRTKRSQNKLYSSVVQSEVFNRYIHLRIAVGLDRPLRGEVVRLDGTGSHFAVESPEAEAERWSTGDLLPTGPMPGPRGPQPTDDALALEREACLAAGLDEARLGVLASHAPGTRRDLRLPVPDLDLTVDGDVLQLSFPLPAGAYATQVVREFTRSPFLPTPELD
ncbi:MAG: tRNA pseudouridine(13) synthase TruD [Deltaproteobacteria bacterium]|nr:MAG: tRNA pseudouridine(13) synthase TruD [Deltaproteobacteria bacterium]